MITKDGWLKTGDIGYLDQEGFLYIKDRSEPLAFPIGENLLLIPFGTPSQGYYYSWRGECCKFMTPSVLFFSDLKWV